MARSTRLKCTHTSRSRLCGLAGLLAATPALEKLSLYESKASSLAPLAAALHAHGAPRLRVLNLAWNRLHSAVPLAAALAAGAAPLLVDLRLDSNQARRPAAAPRHPSKTHPATPQASFVLQ